MCAEQLLLAWSRSNANEMIGFASQAIEFVRSPLDGIQIARVLCGDDAAAGDALTEDRLLDLEREAFMMLVKILARIEHTLTAGNALRSWLGSVI